jgi:hypothetical protein
MKLTVELRWFFHQHLPEEVKGWFCGSRLCVDETARTDDYLVMPGSNEVGVKLRGGRTLEIKARTQAPEPFSLTTGATLGRQDAWTKWSLDDDEVAARLAMQAGSAPHWVPVAKKRWLREFRIDQAGSIDETNPDPTSNRGVKVELAEVNVRGSYWWTLAFESFGEGNRAADLAQVARHFLKILPKGLVLTEHDSMAYPEWLNRLAG